MLFIEEEDKLMAFVVDWTSENDKQDRKRTIQMLAYAGCALGVLAFVISILGKKVLCRCIPCTNLSIPGVVTQVITLLA